MINKKLLLDSDIFFSLINKNDANHQRITVLNKSFLQQKMIYFTSNLVIYETATVLSYKISQQAALAFLDRIKKRKIETVWINEELEKNAFVYFQKQPRKNTSFVDCLNMAILKKYQMQEIFSFDRIYKLNGFKRKGVD